MIGNDSRSQLPEEQNTMDQECTSPGTISSDDLAAFAEGLADEQTIEHLRHCPACAREAQELVLLQAALAGRLYRHSCPPAEQLIAYREGELVGNEHLIVSRHLQLCPHCARELAALAHEERQTLAERLGAALQLIKARPAAPQLLPAMRGGRSEDDLSPEGYEYEAGEVNILVTLQPAAAQPGWYDLMGLVYVGEQVPEGIGGAKVELYRDQELVAITAVSPRGQFTIPDVRPASYKLVLLWEHRDIHIEGVQVGPHGAG